MSERASTPDLGRTFCDLVMKGGITSGVVYPGAVAGLARRYRLRNIGGASAGAIAAAAAAAAEHRRQKHGSDAGFRRLEGLAAELGAPAPGDGRGRSLLFHLFAPTRLSRPLFDVVAAMLNLETVPARVALGLTALVRAFPLTFVVGLLLLAACAAPLVAAVAGGGSAWRWLGVVPALLALVLAFAAGALLLTLRRALRHLERVMARQDFGLCTGLREEGEGTPALTEWLHGLFQELAGEPGGTPLTFGDLRRLRFAETPGHDGVVLRLMTTCLTLGRPYTLPFHDRLYFDPAELARYFPADVVAWMERQAWRPRSKEDEQADAFAAARVVDGLPRPLRPIPEPDDLPVLVGVRMSLSFPLLLSAIPLHRYGVRREGGAWAPWLERLVFTDGGVCSNLPIHLFDSPMPRWPTFAINLRDDLPPGSPDADRVVRPDRGRRYQGDRCEILAGPSLGSVASFLGAIVQTMQNWRDMLQRSAPGYRERVYTIRHTGEEGGLNLDMPREAIAALAASGARAAEAIAADYLAPAGTRPVEDDWEYHRWVRLRLLLPTLRGFLGQLSAAATAQAPSPTVEELLGAVPPPMGRSHELSQASRAAAGALLDELAAASQALEGKAPDLERTAPRPQGELRVTPTF